MSASPAPASPDLPLRKRLRSSGPVSPPIRYRPLRSWEVEEQIQDHRHVKTVPPLLRWGQFDGPDRTKDGLSELEWMRLRYGQHLHAFTADMVESFKNQPLFFIYHNHWYRPDPGVDPWPCSEVCDHLMAVRITDGEGEYKHCFYPGTLFQHCHVYGHMGVFATIHYPEPDHPEWSELYVYERDDGSIGARPRLESFYVFAKKQ